MPPMDLPRLERISRLRGLMKNWTATRQTLDGKQAAYADLSAQNTSKLSLLNKLSRWLDQICALQRKEQDIISQIDEIERQHRMMRKAKKLPRAKPLAEVEPPAPIAPRKDKKGLSPWVIALILCLMDRRPKQR